MELVSQVELSGEALWRRQNARNLMDCYALGMELQGASWENNERGHKTFESLTRQMVEGMMKEWEDEPGEKNFYGETAGLCRMCADVCEQSDGARKSKAGLFRVYAAIFEDMCGEVRGKP